VRARLQREEAARGALQDELESLQREEGEKQHRLKLICNRSRLSIMRYLQVEADGASPGVSPVEEEALDGKPPAILGRRSSAAATAAPSAQARRARSSVVAST
jgi:hypothetical protein